MERFTYKHDGNWCINGKNKGLISDNTASYWGPAIDCLAHYEDLEEQERLVKLPCNLGKRIYMLVSEHEARRLCGCGHCKDLYGYGSVCEYFVNGQCENLTAGKAKQIISRRFWYDHIELFGKTVFLTRAEAEAALAASGKEGQSK